GETRRRSDAAADLFLLRGVAGGQSLELLPAAAARLFRRRRRTVVLLLAPATDGVRRGAPAHRRLADSAQPARHRGRRTGRRRRRDRAVRGDAPLPRGQSVAPDSGDRITAALPRQGERSGQSYAALARAVRNDAGFSGRYTRPIGNPHAWRGH